MKRRVGSVLVLAVLAAVAGCTDSSRARDEQAGTTPARDGAQPLRLSMVPVPDVRLPHYVTSGDYPQVAQAGLDLAAVNAALRDAVLADQKAYRTGTYEVLKDVPTNGYTGTYRLSGDPTLVVANSVLVSTMYDSLALYPGGNDGGGWISTTVLVPSGKAVALADLFSRNPGPLPALARLTKAELVRLGWCAPQPDDDLGKGWYDQGLRPVPANYRDFALAPDGLDIGFAQSQLGYAACGPLRITLPWQQVRPFLSPLGRRLARAAGEGLTVAPCSRPRLVSAFEHRPESLRSTTTEESGFELQWATCVQGWALGYAGPRIDEAGGETILFRSDGLQWKESGVVAVGADFELAQCDLTARGVPLWAAAQLYEGPATPTDRGCP